MISSLSGLVLDSFNLTKPAGFKPDLAGRTAFLATFKQSYFPGGPYPGSGTYLETTGASSGTPPNTIGHQRKLLWPAKPPARLWLWS